MRATPGKTLLMGVINVTPDSFYDGGRIVGPDAVRARAETILAEGADCLDIGAESSRPGAAPIGVKQELERLLPALESLRGLSAPLSVDTYRAETARRALDLGAAMINDISACRADPELAEIVANASCDYVLMHMQGTPRDMQQNPRYSDVVDEICAFFDERLKALTTHGIAESRIWLDPGFGFGKTVLHNLQILRRLREFKRFGRPLLIGTSNKATIGKVLDLPVDQRTEGTAATVALAIAHGADAVRVQEVQAMARVARMADAVMFGGSRDYA